MRLGELLIEAGAVTTMQLEQALGEQAQYGGRLGSTLVELGFITDGTLSKVLAQQLHLPRVSEAALDKLPRNVLNLVTSELAMQFAVCPVRLDGPRLHLAMSDPLNRRAIDVIGAHTGLEIRPLVAADGLIRHALQKHYGIIPRSKFIQVRSDAAINVLRHGQSNTPGSALADVPVFDPYGGATNDARLVEVGDRSVVEPPRATRGTGARPPVPTAARPVVPSLRADPIGEHLAATRTIDEIAEVIAKFVAIEFPRVALLRVHTDRLLGWRVHGSGTASGAVGSFSVPLSALPALAQALANGEPWIGRDPALVLPLIALLGDPAGALSLVLPLRHKGRIAACAIAFDGRSGVEKSRANYARLAGKVDLAFQIVGLRKQLLE